MRSISPLNLTLFFLSIYLFLFPVTLYSRSSRKFLPRGWILGQNPEKSLKSFPPCFSQSPRQLCREISISSNSRNLLQFSHCTLYNVKKKGGQPDRKPYPLPYGLRNPYRNLKSENSQDYAQKPQQNCMFISRSFLLLWTLLVRSLFSVRFDPC
jgi:hypothetical protein